MRLGLTRAAPLGLLLCLGCAFLTACGTDIRQMIERDGATTWRAQRMAELAGSEGEAYLAPLNAAEDEKIVACQQINDAARERTEELHVSFFEALWSDLQQLVAYLLPIPSVERCAKAHKTYRRAYEDTLDQLDGRGILSRDQLSLARAERLGR